MENPLKKVTGLKPVAEFKAFLTKSNALALAIGVVIGTAIGKVVGSIVSDLLMPLVGLAVPGGTWREWSTGPNSQPDKPEYVGIFKIGNFVGSVIDFVIVAFVIFLITKLLLREAKKPDAAPTTKPCPECLEQVPLAAKRCRACTSAL
jgi:large conductance mechanosensitive channel